MKIKSEITIIILVCLLLGAGGGFLVARSGILSFNLFCDKSKFKYINQDLACERSPIVSKQSYAGLKNKLDDFIQIKINGGEISDVAVYFRDLQNGPTMGINEYEKFIPASLLKVPLLLAYLNLAEDQPEVLEKQLAYRKNKEETIRQSIPPRYSIEENTPYSVNDLLKGMIVYSDNQAYYVLLEYLNQISPDRDLLAETLQDLGIIDPQTPLDETITVKSYASVFVQLYHASFLDKKETSEQALSLLAQADFKAGIEAGLPDGVKSAHKFGEREFQDGRKQLHDCGIVYYPKNPYLICVMTRGYDMDKMAGVISSISGMIYQEFDSRRL